MNNNLGDFPVEILSLIVEYVCPSDQKKCALVNKRFHAVTNPFLWRTFMLTDEIKCAKLLSTIIQSKHGLGRHIRRLAYHVPFKTQSFLSFMEQLPLLEELKFHGMIVGQVADAVFQHVPRYCPQLKALTLSKVDVGPLTLCAIANHCSKLLLLNLQNVVTLPANTFELLAPCPLTHLILELDAMDGIEDDHALAEKAALDVTQLRTLKQVSLYNAPNHFAQQLMTLASSPDVLPQMTCLELDGDFNDQQIIAFIKAHPGLTVMQLKHASGLTNATLEAIPTYLPKVTTLSFKYSKKLTAYGVYRLVNRCTTMTLLGLKGCRIKSQLLS
ncbi:unnamed protein product [Absidia cylindrospora]